MQNDMCASTGTSAHTATANSSSTCLTRASSHGTDFSTVATSASTSTSTSTNTSSHQDASMLVAMSITNRVSPTSSFTSSPGNSSPVSATIPAATATAANTSAAAAIAAATLASFHKAQVRPQPQPLPSDTNHTHRNDQHKPNDTNVDQVVAKSKRAASLLWMLLHAQNCPSPPIETMAASINQNNNNDNHNPTTTTSNNNTCPFKGCTEVKQLLLHIQKCPAKNHVGRTCPTNYQGCQDSRKLLAHYRQCRDKAKLLQRKQQSRVNKVNLIRQRQQQPQQTNFCLICTLLAKHDKDVTEKMKAKRKLKQQQHYTNYSYPHQQKHYQQQQQQQHQYLEHKSSPHVNFESSIKRTSPFSNGHCKTVQFDLNPQPNTFQNRNNTTCAGVDTSNATTHTNNNSINNNSNNNENNNTSSSAPKNNNKNNNNSNMPPPLPRSRARTSSIGSLTSLLRVSKAVKSTNKKSSFHYKTSNRPRATSLDEKRTLSTLSNIAYALNDPTIELELMNSQSHSGLSSGSTAITAAASGIENVQGDGSSNGINHGIGNMNTPFGENSSTATSETLPFRKRSVSCSIVYNSSTDRQQRCETIMEE